MAEGGSIRTDRLVYCNSCANSFRRSEEMVLQCPTCSRHVHRFTEEADVIIPTPNATRIRPMNYGSATARSGQASRQRRSRSSLPMHRAFPFHNIHRSSTRLEYIAANIPRVLERLDSVSASVSRMFERQQLFPAVTQAQLEEIPKATITKEQEDLVIKCTVCLDPFKMNEDEIRKLPCNHLFHEECIFPWLKTNPSCPVCRAPLPNQRNGLFDSADERQTTVLVFRRAVGVSVTVNRTSHQVLEGENSSADASHNENSTTRTGRQETRVPRRAAALRASRAINEIYRPRGRNGQRRDIQN